jgi:hypothetical protein
MADRDIDPRTMSMDKSAALAKLDPYLDWCKLLRTPADMLAPQPPPNWLIADWSVAGSVTGVFGAPGSKKTWSMIDQAVCIAMGKTWMGRATQTTRVLWLDEDNGERRTLARLGQSLRAHEAPADTAIFSMSLAGVNLNDETSVEHLVRIITDRHIGAVYLDTLQDGVGGAKIVSPDEMRPTLQTMRRIADATNCAWTFIHHTNRLGDYMGAITIAGKVDLLVGVTSNPDSAIVTFESQKVRDGAPMKFAAEMLFYPDMVWLRSADISQIEARKKVAALSGAARQVYDYLSEHVTGTKKDMATDTLSEDAIKKALQRMKEDGLVMLVETHKGSGLGVYKLTSGDAETCGDKAGTVSARGQA